MYLEVLPPGMRRSTWKRLAGHALGFLLTVAGTIAFLLVVLEVYAADPSGSLENLSRADVPLLLASVFLLVLGRYLSYRFGAGYGGRVDGPDDRSKPERVLAEYGYRVPPDETDRDRCSEATDDGVGGGGGDGAGFVRCVVCGAKNDGAFTYCSECAAELPS